ncbi:MAG: hypothetical protein OER95_01380 [Acidimicrobiia bacterium]|nr:hypothetical protein [Acidimicrobiia bacterium]
MLVAALGLLTVANPAGAVTLGAGEQGPVVSQDDGTDGVEAPEVSQDLARFGALDRPRVSKDRNPVDIAPDLTVLVGLEGAPDADWVVAVREQLLDHEALKSVAVQSVGDADTAFHLWLVEPTPAWLSVAEIADSVGQVVLASVAEDGVLVAPAVTVGGRALADHQVAGSFAGSLHWMAVVALMLAVAVAWRLDWRRGALFAVALVGSVYLAGQVAVMTTGRFDGTLVTTPLVGAMAGLAMALVVGFRIVRWYQADSDGTRAGTDGADLIRSSLMEVANDIILVLGATTFVIGAVWIGGGLFRPLAAVVVGGLIGAAFAGAVLAPALAVLHRSQPASIDGVAVNLPDGRQLMLLTVLGLIGVPLVLAAFVFREPGIDLLDHRVLDQVDGPGAVGARLGGGPGDPTDAVIGNGPADAIEAWAAAAAASLPTVAWVDTPDNRYSGPESSSVDPLESLASEQHLGVRADGFAVVVPAVPIRGTEGIELLDDLAILANGRVELSEGSNSLDRGSTTLVVLTVLLLAVVGGGIVMVETENSGFAATSFVLRLVGGAATVGVYRLLVSEAPVAESLAALGVVSLLVGMFELEFLHHRLRLTAVAGPSLGLAALVAAGVVTVGGLAVAFGSLFGGGPTAGRFGLAVAVALLIEIAVGFMVLRPVLFGEDAAYHTVARPIRSTLHTGQRSSRAKPVSVDDPHWRRQVTDLLIAEFGLQTDPEVSQLDQVFLDGTPLFRQAAAQHRNLSSANLRVTGLAPQLRKVEAFREGPSSMLSVTVDHPERHLVDADGTVYGVRRAERRLTMLWLVASEPGRYRIAESIELGSVSLDDRDPDVGSETFPEVASIVG